MNTPEPSITPYDITPMPNVPFAPSIVEWSIAILFLVAVLCLIWWGSRKARTSGTSSFRKVQNELSRISRLELSRDVLEGASSLVRTFLATKLTGLDFRVDGLTSRELRALADAPETPRARGALLRALAVIEDARFAHDSSIAKEAFAELPVLLLSFHEEHELKDRRQEKSP